MEYGAAPPPGPPRGVPLGGPSLAAAERAMLGAGGYAGGGDRGGDHREYTGYMEMADSDMGARGPDLYAARRLTNAEDGIVRYLPPGPPLRPGEPGAPVDIGIICNSQRARFFPARQVRCPRTLRLQAAERTFCMGVVSRLHVGGERVPLSASIAPSFLADFTQEM